MTGREAHRATAIGGVVVRLNDGRVGQGERPWSAVVDALYAFGPNPDAGVAVDWDDGDKWSARAGHWWIFDPHDPSDIVLEGTWEAIP